MTDPGSLHGWMCLVKSSSTDVSQALLRCLSLAANDYFRKPSCCVFAKKLILIDLDRSRSDY